MKNKKKNLKKQLKQIEKYEKIMASGERILTEVEMQKIEKKAQMQAALDSIVG